MGPLDSFAAAAAHRFGTSPAPAADSQPIVTAPAAVDTTPAFPASRVGLAAFLSLAFVVVFFGLLWGVGELTGEALFKKAASVVEGVTP